MASYWFLLIAKVQMGIVAKTRKSQNLTRLRKADSPGSTQARQELASLSAEKRADSARELLDGIQNAALPQQVVPVNSFLRVAGKLPSSEIINGRYKGYLLQYEWSGKKWCRPSRWSWTSGMSPCGLPAVIPPGTYFLQVLVNGMNHSFKVLKM